MLWAEIERPQTLDECDCQPLITNKFRALAEKRDIPHLLVHGPHGAGKKTRVNALLHALFGREVYRVEEYEKTFRVGTVEKSVMIPESKYHTILVPPALPVSDRYLVQYIIKSQAEIEVERAMFRVVVIHEADKLSHAAQHALRRLMEQYIDACRLILVASSTSAIIEPLQSRLVSIRVPHPSPEEVAGVVSALAEKKGVVGACPSLKTRSLFQAQLQLQMYHVTGSVEPEGDWRSSIQEIVTKSVRKASPETIATFRNDWVAIFGWGFLLNEIIEELYKQGLDHIDNKNRKEWLMFCVDAEVESLHHQNPIYHVEYVIMKMINLK